MDERFIDVSYDEDNGLRLIDAINALRRHFLVCLAAGIAVAGLFLGYTLTQMTPQFEASFTVYASNRPAIEESDDQETTPYYLGAGDVDASYSLANTCAFIFESSEMSLKAVELAKLDAYEERAYDKELVTTSIEQKTPLVTVTVTADSPEDAYQLADALLTLIPDRISLISRGSTVSVIEPIQMPTKQSSPSNKLNAAIGFILGFGLSALVVIALSGRDQRIKDEEDLESRFGMPAVVDAQGVLPLLPWGVDRTVGITDVDGGDLAALDAIALAESFAARGAHAIVIDGDTVNARCCKLLGIDQAPGLSEVLGGKVSSADVIQHVKDKDVDFIAPGERSRDFALKVRSDLAKAILELKGAYDCVVVAMPSVLTDDSALVQADAADRVFLSVREGNTQKPSVAEALRRLKLAGVRVVGFVYGKSRGRLGHQSARRR